MGNVAHHLIGDNPYQISDVHSYAVNASEYTLQTANMNINQPCNSADRRSLSSLIFSPMSTCSRPLYTFFSFFFFYLPWLICHILHVKSWKQNIHKI